MIVKDPQLLREFAESCRCAWCGSFVPSGCHPHHLTRRGMGGGSRLDVRINLCALCPLHHQEAHDGKISRAALLRIVARREGRTARSITEEIHKILRTPK